jgi:uncharacterized protein YkuJ
MPEEIPKFRKWFCLERREKMSQLQGILTRLKNLQEQSVGGEPMQRFFEVNGEKKCQVTYHPKNETFELEVYNDKEKPKRYQFDNIDMITIEVFDLIQ